MSIASRLVFRTVDSQCSNTTESENVTSASGSAGRSAEMNERSREVFLASEEMSTTADFTLDYVRDNVWLVGDPDEVARQIRELHAFTGGFGVLLMIAHDWDDPTRWKRSMELLAKEVMPRVADLELTVAAR